MLLVRCYTLLPHRRILDIRQRLLSRIRMQISDLLEGHSRAEGLGLPCLGTLGVEFIDLFKRETLGLVDEAPDEESADEAEPTPNKEDFGAKVGVARAWVDHVRSCVGDCPVEEPVAGDESQSLSYFDSGAKDSRCGGHGKRLGSSLERENFSCDNPGTRSPRAGKEENIDTDESDESTLSGQVCSTSPGADACDDELANSHANGAEEEKRASTPFLNHVKAREGRGNVNAGGDDGSGEGIGNTRPFEKLSPVVENKVDTRQLLKSLKQATSR